MIEQNILIANPFPGLRPFELDENELFFGRDGQSDEVLFKLRTARFVAVVGTSGSGKSSLVRAGLLPALLSGHMTSAGSSWRMAIFRPGSSPISNLAKALSEPDVFGSTEEEGDSTRLARIERTLRRSSLGLLEVVSQARMAPHENLLILADQFEELFRFRKKSSDHHPADEAAAFVKLLLETKQPDKAPEKKLPIYVILTMRSDYLGDCASFWGLPEAINEGQYLIPRMTDDDRREAVSGPILISGGQITAPLVNRLLNDAGDDPAQLPILQHALMRTWDYWKHHVQASQPIDIPHYENIGGMTDALSKHADEAFLELSPELQKVAEKLFKSLTEKEADNREGRRPATVAEICAIAEASEEQVKTVIESFRREGRSFLMPPPKVTLQSDTLIDISHESLIRGWQRLRKWVDEEAQAARQYTRLAETAALFPEYEGFLRDPALQIGLNWRAEHKPTKAWAERYHPGFDKTIEYLEQSKANREAEVAEKERHQKEKVEQAEAFAAEQKRRVRQQRWGLLILSLLLLAMTSLTAYAFQQKRAADTQRTLAEKALKDAEREYIRATQAESVAIIERQKTEEALVTVEDKRNKALEAEKDAAEQRDTAERERKEADHQRDIARNALSDAQRERDNARAAQASALAAEKVAVTAKEEAEVQREEATKALETVREIDKSPPYAKETMRGQNTEVRSVSFSPDGKRLVTAGKDNSAWLWDVETGQSSMTFGHDGPVTSATLSHDGSLIATASDDQQIGIWNVETSFNVWKFGSPGKKSSVAFSPDDKMIAAINQDASIFADYMGGYVRGVVEVLTIAEGPNQKPKVLQGHSTLINSLDFSPDSKFIVTTSNDRTARIWDTTTGKSVFELAGHLKEVTRAKFSNDGKLVVTASADGTARIWNAQTGELLNQLLGLDAAVTSAAFSPDGKYIVTTSKDRALLWEPKSPGNWKEVSDYSPTVLAGHIANVNDAIFTPDSKLVVTISQDWTAQIWRAETLPPKPTGREYDMKPGTAASLAVFRGHIKPLTSVAVSKDSKYVVTGSEDRTARVWNLTGISGFRVNEPTLKAAPADYTGTCPVTVKVTGTVSAVGGSGVVKYKFVRQNGGESRVQELKFDAPGSQEVSETEDVYGGVSRTGQPLPTSGWVELRILEPVEMQSNRASYKVHCQDSGGQQLVAYDEISSDQLKQIMPKSTEANRALYLPHLRKAMQEFGINTTQRQAAFLAAVAYNTEELSSLEEEGPDGYFEKVYGQRKDLGNFQPGDGARFKDRGGLMLVGRYNYQAFGELLGVDLIADPAKAATPEVAFRLAALYWQRNGLTELADKWDIVNMVKKIEGGVRNLAGYMSYFDRAKAVLDRHVSPQ